MSRELTVDDVRRESKLYTPVHNPVIDTDMDTLESWYYPDGRIGPGGIPLHRPQTRVYRIIDRKGRPSGRLVYAKNEIQAAALRQELRDQDGKVYQPAAELVDVIYDDED